MTSSYDARFGGIRRLLGAAGQQRLRQAHVGVIGLGGVGSWAVEALARSGLGRLTLVDLDDICISNVNRQLHALDGDLGKPKAEVLGRRVLAINPECAVQPVRLFFTQTNAQEILDARFDYVLDAIDSPSKKCLLIALCRQRAIPVITTGAAAGRRDPTAVRVTDLAFTQNDRLTMYVRKILRARYGFPRHNEPFDVECVCSTELPVFPKADGAVCAQRPVGGDLRLDCQSGFGTASFVTGTFGLVAASQIVRRIALGRTGEELKR